MLDLRSGGRLSVIAGIGYRPEEYAAHGKDWANRGALMDECVDTHAQGVDRRAVRVPRHHRAGHAAAVHPAAPAVDARRHQQARGPPRRAVRAADLPRRTMPELEAYYYEQCAEHGTQGFCMMPGERAPSCSRRRGPRQGVGRARPALLARGRRTYAGWQTPDIKLGGALATPRTVDELRAEGMYQVSSPPTRSSSAANAQGRRRSFNLHPLCGGMPIDEGVGESLQLYVDKVLPRAISSTPVPRSSTKSSSSIRSAALRTRPSAGLHRHDPADPHPRELARPRCAGASRRRGDGAARGTRSP